MITAERLREVIEYYPEDGSFRWAKSRRGVRKGDKTGTLRPDGYIKISIDGKCYLAHRLAWLFMHGAFPENDIDHVNRKRDDNRIANLRLCTRAENLQNISVPSTNSSGFIGVRWHKQRKKWNARICVDGREVYLGVFDNRDEAIEARRVAKEKYHLFNSKDAHYEGR